MKSRIPATAKRRTLAGTIDSTRKATIVVFMAQATACGNGAERPARDNGFGGSAGSSIGSATQAGDTFAAGGSSGANTSAGGSSWLGAAGSSSPAAAIRRIPTPWIHASGTGFADDQEHPVRFVGVGLSNDAWGIYVWPESETLTQQGKDPLIRPTELYPWCLTDVDFELLDGLPINVVRYSFAYETFAADNPKLEANLATLEANVTRLGAIGIYVVLNDNMPIGLDGVTDVYARKLSPAEREQSIFENDDYLAKDLAMWKMLAQRLAGHPELLAYELINEPRVPSPSEGGQGRFQERLQSLVAGIREVDPKHVILVPEWNSRENSDSNQTVIWDQGMVKVDDSNVGYVLHLYTPWDFASNGASSYDSATVIADLQRRINWRDVVGHAPLFATEYGVNRKQPMTKRVEWMSLVDDLFLRHGVSSIWFNYKANASAYVEVKSVFALTEQYVKKNDEVVPTATGWDWKSPQTQAAAESNGFVDWYQTYFVNLGPDDVSLTDSQPIVAELSRYQAAE